MKLLLDTHGNPTDLSIQCTYYKKTFIVICPIVYQHPDYHFYFIQSDKSHDHISYLHDPSFADSTTYLVDIPFPIDFGMVCCWYYFVVITLRSWLSSSHYAPTTPKRRFIIMHENLRCTQPGDLIIQWAAYMIRHNSLTFTCNIER